MLPVFTLFLWYSSILFLDSINFSLLFARLLYLCSLLCFIKILYYYYYYNSWQNDGSQKYLICDLKTIFCCWLHTPFYLFIIYRILLFVKPQHESAIGIHISLPFWTSLPSPIPSHPSRLIQSPCLSCLSHTANSSWLSVLHMIM